MSQQKQAPLPRQEFQEWLENAAVPVLVLQKGKHLGSVVKVPATPEIDYLFGCETFYGERISWSDRLEFCGLYDRQHQALHLLDDPLPNFVSGLTEEECQDSTAFGKRIAQEVDRYVEAAISNERSRLSVRELTSERNINSYRYYKGTEAGREAASLVFSGEKPDVQFHSEYYTSLTEDTLLSYYQADKVHQGALPVPVRLMMDEFCNVSLPDDFGKLQATMRSRNIMSTIVLQNISALKALFKDDWEGLLGNADTLVYLGGNEPSTHKYISELLGKETLDTRNRSVSRGSHGSSSVSYQQTGRDVPYLFVKSSVALNLS